MQLGYSLNNSLVKGWGGQSPAPTTSAMYNLHFRAQQGSSLAANQAVRILRAKFQSTGWWSLQHCFNE